MRTGTIFLMCLLSVPEAHASDIVADVSGAINSAIRWQEAWYGSSFGADCVRQRAIEGAGLTVFFPDAPVPSSAGHGNSKFAAYVSGTNVLYSGTFWDGKAVVAPSAGNPHACSPGEIAPQVSFDPARGGLVKGKFVLEDPRPRLQASTLDMARVASMVLRSLKAYAVEKGVDAPKTVLLGKYSPEDPYLLVLINNRSELHLLDFPAVSEIGTSTIVHVYSGDVFLGPDASVDDRNHTREHLLIEMDKHSTMLK